MDAQLVKETFEKFKNQLCVIRFIHPKTETVFDSRAIPRGLQENEGAVVVKFQGGKELAKCFDFEIDSDKIKFWALIDLDQLLYGLNYRRGDNWYNNRLALIKTDTQVGDNMFGEWLPGRNTTA